MEWGGELRLAARTLQIDHQCASDVAGEIRAVILLD